MCMYIYIYIYWYLYTWICVSIDQNIHITNLTTFMDLHSLWGERPGRGSTDGAGVAGCQGETKHGCQGKMLTKNDGQTIGKWWFIQDLMDFDGIFECILWF